MQRLVLLSTLYRSEPLATWLHQIWAEKQIYTFFTVLFYLYAYHTIYARNCAYRYKKIHLQVKGATRRYFSKSPFLKNISTVKVLLIIGTFWWQTVPLLRRHLLMFLAARACTYAHCFFPCSFKAGTSLAWQRS